MIGDRTMEIVLAEHKDIAVLTELRLAYLKEDYGELSEDTTARIKRDLPAYFEKNLNQNIFCYLIRKDGEAAACAFLLVVEKPLNPMFLSGKTGTVLNVYTAPQYRRRGYARRIMEKLLMDAVEKDLSIVELKSTDDGYHLYKSIGFSEEASKYHNMKWRNPNSAE